MLGVARYAVAAAVLLLAARGAVADDQLYSPRPAQSWHSALSEIRLGLSAHKAWHTFLPLTLPTKYNYSEIDDLSVDFLLTQPDWSWWGWIGSPRPNIGATFNLGGKESTAHVALTWHAPIFDTPLYAEGTFGIAANTGYLHDAPPGYQNMGCNVQFYEVFGLGTNIGEHATATVTYEHTSNAELCDYNDGLSNFGIRIGYKF